MCRTFSSLPANICDICVEKFTGLSYHIDMSASVPVPVPKHRQVYNALRAEITAGSFPSGQRLPSEADLVKTFGASRITVGRALRDLQQDGLIERRAGSGTYVRRAQDQALPGRFSFGLLIPDLAETEILEPIVRGLTAAPGARDHAFLSRRRVGFLPGAEGNGRVGAVRPVHRTARGRGLLRAARAHARQGRGQFTDHCRFRSGRHSDCAARPLDPALRTARGARPRRDRQSPRRVPNHRTSAAARYRSAWPS